MASFEGSIGVPSGGFNLLVEYSISQSIDGNYSDVSATGYVKRNNSSYYPYNSQSSSSLTIDGSSAGYSGSYNLGSDGYKAIVSHSKRVYHNPDGTKGITISFSFNGLLSNWYPNGSISQYITLPTIPRASGVSCTSPNIGEDGTINIDKKSNNFTSTVWIVFGNVNQTIATKTSNVSLPFRTNDIKSQLYAQIPNAKSGVGTVYCDTYSGNTKIGETQSSRFYLYAKENECKPDVSGVVIDTNEDTIDLTGDSSVLVKNASKPKVTVSATPKYSSTISGYSINLNDGQTSNNRETTFNTINSNSITVSATDSRGYSNSYTIDLTNRVINYIKLAFNGIDLQRPESTSNEVILNANGAFYNGDFSQSITNELSCSFQYRESGAQSWTNGGTITPTITNNTFRFTNVSLGTEFDYEKEYQFKIIANDLLMTVGNESKDIHVVTKGIAVVEIGDSLVNVNGDFTINDKSTDYIVESGTSGIWQYRKWNSGLAECWGTYYKYVDANRGWGSLYRGDTFKIDYPFTFIETPIETFGSHSEVTSFVLNYYGNSTTQSCTYNICYYQTSQFNAWLDLYVRGKWK